MMRLVGGTAVSSTHSHWVSDDFPFYFDTRQGLHNRKPELTQNALGKNAGRPSRVEAFIAA